MSGISCGKRGCTHSACYCVEVDLDGTPFVRGDRLLGSAEATLCGRHLEPYIRTRSREGFIIRRVESLEDEP